MFLTVSLLEISLFVCVFIFFTLSLARFRPSSLDIDKSETTPLFPSNAPSASISPTAPLHTGTMNRTLPHHQQTATHGIGAGSGIGGIGSSGTLGSHRNGTAGMRTGFVATSSPTTTTTTLQYNNHPHRTNASAGIGGGVGNTGTAIGLVGSATGILGGRLTAGGSAGGKASPSPPPGYDVVVHGTRHGFY